MSARGGCYGVGVTERARRSVLAAAAALAALALASCGSDIGDPLSFKFDSKAPSGAIDQTLTLLNREHEAVAPVLDITPLDAAGRRLAGVAVHTAYGSDRGLVVVPARSLVNDVLTFRGRAAHRVRKVRVVIARRILVPGASAGDPPVVQRFDRNGTPVGTGARFDAFRVSNESASVVAARVVLLEYDHPAPGDPQQAIRVTSLTGLLKLAPRASRMFRLPAGLRDRAVGSLKAYVSR